MANQRTTSEVFEDHLRLRQSGDLEEDLRRNFAEDVVLLAGNSNGRGHAAIRASFRRLREQMPGGRFQYLARQVCGPYALLVWRGRSSRFDVFEGADTFVIESGKIRLHTIHYRLADSP